MSLNFFKWFNLPEAYEVDSHLLQEAYYKRSKSSHPDNFQDKSEFEKQVAEKALSYTHEAYATLRCPVKRAAYLLFIQGIDLNSEDIERTPLLPQFLAKAFEWQLEINEPGMHSERETQLQTTLNHIATLLNNKQFEMAIMPIREAMFMKKLGERS